MPRSPYTPSAGKMPNYLAGRDDTIEAAEDALNAFLDDGYSQPIVFYGLRGVGKTVLLSRIENDISDDSSIVFDHIEASEEKVFKRSLYLGVQKMMHKLSGVERAKAFLKKAVGVVKAFRVQYAPEANEFSFGLDVDALDGSANTGVFNEDLVQLFIALGELAKEAGCLVCFFIDEIQYLQEDELNALIMALHRSNQKDLPIMVIGAGLPKVLQGIGEAKSYGERLFNFFPIGELSFENTSKALVKPAETKGVLYEQDAIERIYDITKGYPYFIQEYGDSVWHFIENNKITLSSVEHAYQPFIDKLDSSFFKVRYDRATAAEKRFLHAMARCPSLPCNVSDIANLMGQKLKSTSPSRAQLIHKGLIYATGHGELDFSVPLFSEFLARFQPVVE